MRTLTQSSILPEAGCPRDLADYPAVYTGGRPRSRVIRFLFGILCFLTGVVATGVMGWTIVRAVQSVVAEYLQLFN